ncbi:MAG: hypothetical protein J5892_03675 [Bacilli bacterium]|nr:hypothetical protein [Bacilli bacterium]
MEIQSLHEEIKKINNCDTLTNQEKKERIRIYQCFIEKILQHNKYKDTLKNFLESANNFVNTSKGSYQVEDTVDDNLISLKGYILNSDYVNYLKDKNINTFSKADLRYLYPAMFKKEFGYEPTDIYEAITLMEQIDNLKNIESEIAYQIAFHLKNIIDKSLLPNRNKSEDELNKNYEDAKNSIINAKELDSNSKRIAMRLLDDLFNYYLSGNKKIPTINTDFNDIYNTL